MEDNCASDAGARRADSSRGREGVRNGRKPVEAAVTSILDAGSDHVSIVRMRIGERSISAATSIANFTERPDAGEYRKHDEHGSDFSFEEGAKAVGGGGGDFRDYLRGYRAL